VDDMSLSVVGLEVVGPTVVGLYRGPAQTPELSFSQHQRRFHRSVAYPTEPSGTSALYTLFLL